MCSVCLGIKSALVYTSIAGLHRSSRSRRPRSSLPAGGVYLYLCLWGVQVCTESEIRRRGYIRRHSLHHEATGTDHPRVLRTGTPVSMGGRRVVELVGSFDGCARGGRHSIPDIFASAFGGHQGCKIRYSSSLNPSGHARANPTHTKTDTTLRR